MDDIKKELRKFVEKNKMKLSNEFVDGIEKEMIDYGTKLIDDCIVLARHDSRKTLKIQDLLLLKLLKK